MSLHVDPTRLWTPPENGVALPAPVGRARYTLDHMQLPYKDESVVNNFFENPQSFLLTTSIEPVLARQYPDDQFCIGGDNYIYFDDTNPSPSGAKAPDWFLVLGVSQTVGGVYRRSYVMWRDPIPPLIVIEYVSGNGAEERDRTPKTGKFWAYEQAIRAEYYAIYEPDKGRVEVFRLVNFRYAPVPVNERGHYPIEPLGIELGIWHGAFRRLTMGWMRWWDAAGNLLPSADERAEAEQKRAEAEQKRAETEQKRAEADRERTARLAAKLRELGVDPESV